MKQNIYIATILQNFSTLLFWISIIFFLGVFICKNYFKIIEIIVRLMMILNQKSLNLREYEELNFEDEEEKKLFLLTKYNTLINKSPPIDIENAANKSI